MSWDLPELQWWMAALPAVFLLGAGIATAVTFRQWRWGKKVVPRQFWTRMVDGYVALERSHRKLQTATADTQVAHDAISDRLDLSNQENSALYARLQALEAHLDNVTAEATTLVSGLKDNEQRWVEAETVRDDLQTALAAARAQAERDGVRVEELERQNDDLTARLDHAMAELTASVQTIQKLEGEAGRQSKLQDRLHEALDRDRQRAATLTRLEGRYRATHLELTQALRRADALEAKLRSGTTGATRGVFDRPVPGNEPITLGIYDDFSIDLRTSVDDGPSRGSDRFARSYGRLPD